MVLLIILKSVIFISICKIVSTLNRKDIDTSSVEMLSFCENGWILKWNYCYQLQSNLTSWQGAADFCKGKGGHLVSIHSEEQQRFIKDNILKDASSRVWIGLHDTNSEEKYEWEDGSRVDYFNWDFGEPSGYMSRDEDCVEMIHRGYDIGDWNDVHCHLPKPFICQKKAQSKDSAKETKSTNASKVGYYKNVKESNSSGNESITTFILAIIFTVVVMAQIWAIVYYRRLWMEEKRIKEGAVFFKSNVKNSELSTEVDMNSDESDEEPKYARL